jgi:transcriptional regulator with XRE-family HTH domain
VVEIRDATRLEWFIRTRGLKPKHIAEDAGISRQHLLRLRKGKAQPSAKVIANIRRACARLTRRRVSIHDLFDVGGR